MESDARHEEKSMDQTRNLGSREPAEGTILLVDDDVAAREAFYDILDMLGYRVFTAESGLDAVDIFQRECIDLVISDLLMPNMDGETLYRALQEIEPQVRMIILTGMPLGEGGIELLQNGVLSFLEKPSSIEQVTQIVTGAMQ